MRRRVSTMPDDHVLVKLDFSNAYNIIRRDAVLQTVAAKMPELYRFVHSWLACSPKLIYGTCIIESVEGSQQGDPLSGLEFCKTVHPTLSEGSSRTKLRFVDDFNLEGKVSNLAKDVQRIIDAQAKTGLVLNRKKMRDRREQFRPRRPICSFNNFKKVNKVDLTLLGAPVLPGRAIDK